MVIATQDPKADSMRVDIGNITSRMVFKCATYQASANVINCSGAEKLSGKGEMLFVSADHPHPTFIQGAYVSPQETKELVSAISSQSTDSIPKFVIPEVFEDSKVPGDTVAQFLLLDYYLTNVACYPYLSAPLFLLITVLILN